MNKSDFPKKILSFNTKISAIHVPSCQLCRFFSKQQYLNSFREGEFRFGNLKYYRKSELGVRSDPLEGSALYYAPNGSAYGVLSSGEQYALCFSELNEELDIDLLAKKFGTKQQQAICEKIQDNILLTQRIIDSWKCFTERNHIMYFQWYKVSYTKNQKVDPASLKNIENLNICQKPEKHIIYKLKRIKKTPLPPTKPGSPELIDCGGEIGSIIEFSSLNPSDMEGYESRLSSNPSDWEILEQQTNNFREEQEWRLVFSMSDSGFNMNTGDILDFTDDDHQTLVSCKSY